MGPRQKDSQDPWNPGSLPLFTHLRIGEVSWAASVVLECVGFGVAKLEV